MSGIRLFLSIGVACVLVTGLSTCGRGHSSAGRKRCRITAIHPSSGPCAGGTVVTIDTRNFKEDFTVNLPVVTFDLVPASAVVGVDSNTVTVTTPAGPGGGGCMDVTLSTPSCSDTRVDGYCFTGCAVTSMTPITGGTSGGGGATILGDGFDTAVEIRFGDPCILVDPSTVVVTGGTQIDFAIPPAPAGGNVDVEVRNLIHPGSCLVPGGYTYSAPGVGACSVASVVPSSGPVAGGTSVTIRGSGFGAPGSMAGVLVGNLGAGNVTVVSDTEITCVTGPFMGAGGLTVDVTVCPESSDPCVLVDGFTYQ